MIEQGERVVSVGAWWWQGTGPAWIVDRIETADGRTTAEQSYKGAEAEGQVAVLARWQPAEGGVLERAETRVGVVALLQDQPWRPAPAVVIERAIADAGGYGAPLITGGDLGPPEATLLQPLQLRPLPLEDRPVRRDPVRRGHVLAAGWRERAEGLEATAKALEAEGRGLRGLADELWALADEQELDRH